MAKELRVSIFCVGLAVGLVVGCGGGDGGPPPGNGAALDGEVAPAPVADIGPDVAEPSVPRDVSPPDAEPADATSADLDGVRTDLPERDAEADAEPDAESDAALADADAATADAEVQAADASAPDGDTAPTADADALEPECRVDEDCLPLLRPAGPCEIARCAPPGACALVPQADGAPCGEAGRCEAGACVPLSPACPPPPPYGTEVDDTLTDLVLEDCEGGTVHLHDLCGAGAGLIFNYYGW